MSVLETFYILFKSNADDVDKGAQKATKSADKLEQSLAKTDARTEVVGRSFLQLATRASAAIGAVVGFTAVLNSALQAATYANSLADVSKSIGVSVEQISLWSDAVASSGGTVEGFQGTLRGMAMDFAQIETTGKSRLLPFFKELGVRVTDSKGKIKNVMDVLPDLADALSKVSAQKALGIGQKLGLDEGTIMLLQSGRREVDAVLARQKELGVVTARQADIAKKYKDQLADTAHAYRTLSLEVATAVLPVFTYLSRKIEQVINFITSHKDLTVGFFIAVGGAVMAYAVPAFIALAAATIEIWGPIAILVGIISALASAFALVYEDVMVFMRGGDSLIGRVLDWITSFKAFKVVVDALRAALRFLGDTWDSIKGGISTAMDWLNDGDDRVITASGQLIGKAQGQIGLASSNPITSQSSAAIASGTQTSNRNTQVNVGQVTVQTQATDAEGIAGAVGQSMNTQLRQAMSNYDDGVHA